MPPQSRGSRRRNTAHTIPDNFAAHPTLAPFLDNLATPDSATSDQRTPIANEGSTVASTLPTVRRPRRETATSLSDDGEHSDCDSNLDDADFNSHYSVSAESSDSQSPFSDTDDELQKTSQSAYVNQGALHHTAPTQSLPPPPPLPLVPPFYNRPPTPLPPSPSLTSLLRPPSLLNRSTTSTHPTTPDSSDVDLETPNDTEAAVAQSARHATIVSRVSPKVPTYEYYGFVLYLASSLAFLLYLLWSYLPSPFLAALGLYYYPNRWWSLAIPAFLVMSLVYIYIALLSYNVEYLTLPMDSVECVVDEAANIALVDGEGKLRKGGSKMNSQASLDDGFYGGDYHRGVGLMPVTGPNETRAKMGSAGGESIQWRHMWNERTDAVMDVPIGGVCEVLYREGENWGVDLHLDEYRFVHQDVVAQGD